MPAVDPCHQRPATGSVGAVGRWWCRLSVAWGVFYSFPGSNNVSRLDTAGRDRADVFIASVRIDDGVGTAGRSVQQALSWAKHHPLIDNNNSIDGVWWL